VLEKRGRDSRGTMVWQMRDGGRYAAREKIARDSRVRQIVAAARA
jgi:hypothetical protein